MGQNRRKPEALSGVTVTGKKSMAIEPNQGLSPEEYAAPEPTRPEPEKTFRQSDVDQIVVKVKKEAEERAYRRYKSESDQLKSYEQKPDTNPLENLDSLVSQKVESRLKDIEADRIRQHEAQMLYDRFVNRLGDEPLTQEALEFIQDEDTVPALSAVLPLLVEVENTREVLEHLVRHPTQLSAIVGSVRTYNGIKKVLPEIKRLSQAIKQNKEASAPVAKEPISKLGGVNASAGSGKGADTSNWSVKDWQKYLMSKDRR